MLINNKIHRILNNYWPQLLLIAVVLTGYWQIAFFQTTFKFDAIYNHLPWRYLIVDNIRHGHLPLWNYYHHLGTPIHADPQSGAWYPVVWLLSLFGTYDLYTYNFEFILHIIIAGLGMQYLLKVLRMSKETMFFISTAYVFSGFFASNSMFLTWVISAAWIPFVIARFLILLKSPSLRNSLIVALLIFMLLSGGYPAFTIILAYILLIMAAFVVIDNFRKDKLLIKKQIFFSFLTVFLTAVISAVVLVSVFIVVNHMPRGEPLQISEAAIPPFLPEHLLSFILPYSFVELEYDQSVLFDGSNIYIGIITFLFLLTALFNYKSLDLKIKFVFWISVFFVFLSFGLTTPVYELIFNWLPGFKYFRFPTLFRYFGILGFLIISADIFNKIIDGKKWKELYFSLFLTLALLILFFIVSLFRTEVFNDIGNKSLYDFVIGLGFWDKVFFQSVFQIIILFTFFFIIKYLKKNKIWFVFIISALELIIAFNVYMPYTITSYKSDVKQSDKILHDNVYDFSLENNSNILDNSTHPDSLYLFSHFLYIYQKRVGDKGNTFKLTEFNNLKKHHKKEYYQTIDNPLFFFINQKGLIKLLKFNYNSLELSVSNPDSDTLVFLQNFYPGWQLKIDGELRGISKYKHSFMAARISAGNHKISFVFNPVKVVFFFWFSVVALIISLLYLLIWKK